MSAEVRVYTDGACSGNPGPGGWAAVIKTIDEVHEIFGREKHTTNNRMEMMAVIKALEFVNKPSVVRIYSDSEFVINGATKWMFSWASKDWTKASGPIKNLDLWKRIYELNKIHKLHWQWVKAHAGHPENERANELAQSQTGKKIKREQEDPNDEKHFANVPIQEAAQSVNTEIITEEVIAELRKLSIPDILKLIQ